jgi:hypothetical protein
METRGREGSSLRGTESASTILASRTCEMRPPDDPLGSINMGHERIVELVEVDDARVGGCTGCIHISVMSTDEPGKDRYRTVVLCPGREVWLGTFVRF